jgi:ribosomal-protein-alanine N-acetyltransferase
MEVQQASRDHLPEIFKLNNLVQTFPWTKKNLQDEFENPIFIGLVAKDHEKIIGYLLGRHIDLGVEVMTLGVHMEHQRQGIATKLLSSFMGHGSSHPAKAILLEVSENNLGALTLYKKMGFQISGTRKAYYPDGSSAICMKLNIANP